MLNFLKCITHISPPKFFIVIAATNTVTISCNTMYLVYTFFFNLILQLSRLLPPFITFSVTLIVTPSSLDYYLHCPSYIQLQQHYHHKSTPRKITTRLVTLATNHHLYLFPTQISQIYNSHRYILTHQPSPCLKSSILSPQSPTSQ